MKNIFEINSTYHSKELKHEMIEFFENEGFIQLTEFFTLDLTKIKEIILKQKFEKINTENTKYENLIIKNNYQLEIIQLFEFFKSKDFLKFLEEIIDFPLRIKQIKLNKYQNGSYQNEEHNLIKDDIIEVYYDLSDTWFENYNGFTTYSTINEEIFYLEPVFNALSIIFRGNSINKKIDKINKSAENKQIIRIEIQLEITDEENLIE